MIKIVLGSEGKVESWTMLMSDVRYTVSKLQPFGETSWSVNNRWKLGHKKDLQSMNKNPRKTALVHHTYTTRHQFNPEAKKVMKKVHSKRTLKIHETNKIIMNEHRAVNFKSDSEHLNFTT